MGREQGQGEREEREKRERERESEPRLAALANRCIVGEQCVLPAAEPACPRTEVRLARPAASTSSECGRLSRLNNMVHMYKNLGLGHSQNV